MIKRAKARWDALLTEYGAVAFVTYFVIFALTLAGFWFAISLGLDIEGMAASLGFELDGTAAGIGKFGAAYLATKAVQVLRIAATIVLTPFVARAWHKLRPRPPEVVASDEGAAAKPAEAAPASAEASPEP